MILYPIDGVRYLIAIGSNIDPYQNVPRILDQLLTLSSTIYLSRIIETEPVGILDGDRFLNFCVAIDTTLTPQALKQRFNRLEVALGRNRSDKLRSKKSRPADLDILFPLLPSDQEVPSAKLPSESYIRPMLLELLSYLGVNASVDPPNLATGVAIKYGERIIGRQAQTVCTLQTVRSQSRH